ncbi:TLD-domain-containing protein [Diplogelasinospora grovesii]|uniref:Oxidation resistance protein 1 n=1 Tax=Diplogelasinospora grovesii TaxID=303347 RepID=A0AAN6S5H7_9PEZI|nr:TLD-domain-containing protein [Diplogelasinospora grovesii]
MTDYSSHPRSRSSHSDDENSPPASSGAATPPNGGTSASSSTYLSSPVSSFWGGLLRRFSSDTAGNLPHSSSSPSSSLHYSSSHSHTHPYPDHHNGINGVYKPPQIRHRTPSPMRPPPLEPLQLRGFREDTSENAKLLTPAVAEEVRIMVPARLSLVDEWTLIYSLDQDGASLATLYEKCARYQGRRVGFVLVVKDCEGGIFGAYLSDFPHPAPGKYFGNGECFLWRASVLASSDTMNLTTTTSHRTTTIPAPESASALRPPSSNGNNSNSKSGSNLSLGVPGSPSIRFKAFPYSGVNEYYMLCEAHFLSVGAGDGKYGLWLDDSLEKGISSTCQTFGNERLSDEGEKFGILGVEVWVVGASGP